MLQNKDYISQNVAPLGVRRIGVYNANGLRVGQIPLGTLTPPNPAEKLYSFEAVSDVHIVYDTAESDFDKALTYADENDILFS